MKKTFTRLLNEHNFVIESYKGNNKNTIMARPIRNIPILYGKEADAFLRAAEEAEANPGTITISRQQVECTRRMMAEAGML